MRSAALVLLAIAAFAKDGEAAPRVYRPSDPSKVVLRLERAPMDRSASRPMTSIDARLRHAQALQYRHEFIDADNVLSALLAANPRVAQARLMRAQVRLHLKEPKRALEDCLALASLVDTLTTVTCIAQARGQSGEARRAYALLVTTLRSQRGSDAVRSWSAGVAAELASQLGYTQAADEWYREMYRLNPTDHYARLSYARWLASRGRGQEAARIANEIAIVGSDRGERYRSAWLRLWRQPRALP